MLFSELLQRDVPVAYICSAGQDRTGFTTAMILSALGVPRDVIMKDYLLSTTYRQPQFEMPPIDPAMQASNPVAKMFAMAQKDPKMTKAQPLVEADGTPFLAFAFREIDEKWGSVDAYLQAELGVGPAQIAALRAAYLE
jgi:protein-tyrosine phosphatase